MSAMWYSPLLQGSAGVAAVTVEVTGVGMAMDIGFVAAGQPLVGEEIAIALGTLSFVGTANVLVTGVGMQALAGSVGGSEVELTGVETVLSVGTLDTAIGEGIVVEVTGVNINLGISSVQSWTDIPDSQAALWVPID